MTRLSEFKILYGQKFFRSSIEKEEVQTKQLQVIETDFKTNIAQLQEAFRREEKKWNHKQTKFGLEKEKVSILRVECRNNFYFQLNSDIKLMQAHERSLIRKHAEEKHQFALQLEQEQKNHEERSQENVYQIKQLKVTYWVVI